MSILLLHSLLTFIVHLVLQHLFFAFFCTHCI